jgi:hypothetical protein
VPLVCGRQPALNPRVCLLLRRAGQMPVSLMPSPAVKPPAPRSPREGHQHQHHQASPKRDRSRSPPQPARQPHAGSPTAGAPQTWYDEAYGPPASALPPEDIGPALAPGGWRSQGALGQAPLLACCLLCDAEEMSECGSVAALGT